MNDGDMASAERAADEEVAIEEKGVTDKAAAIFCTRKEDAIEGCQNKSSCACGTPAS